MKRFAGIFALTIGLITMPSISSGDYSQWVPRILDYSGELEVIMRYEKNESGTGTLTSSTKDAFFVQRVNLSLDGYVYHPKLILFHVGLSPGLKEENFTQEPFGQSSSTVDTVMDYDLRMQILAEHPYTLELYMDRRTFLITQKFTQTGNPVSEDKGANFFYKQRPFFAVASYRTSTIETGTQTTDYEVYNAGLSHFSGPFSTTGVYRHEDSSTSNGQTTLRNYYYFQNQIKPRWLTLFSSVEYTDLKQSDQFLGPQDSKTLYWTERAEASLPYNFDASVLYSYTKDQFSASLNSAQGELNTRTDNVSFTLTHRLYESLRTQYNFDYLNTHSETERSGTGDLTVTSNSVNVDYTKKIRWGVMNHDVTWSLFDSERSGTLVVPREPHRAALNVPFILNGLNIDISSIVVKVRDPNDPNILSQPLDPSMYVTTVIGPNVQVTVLTVPPDFLSALPNFEYTFEVSYSLSSNVQIRTEEFAYRLSLYLFDNLLNPYFNYSRVTQETTSGTIPGGPENSTSYTAGIIVQKAPFTVLGEYQDVESRILPYQQWRAIVSYRKNLTPTLDVFAQAFVTRTDYGQGQTVPLSTPYTETIVGGDFRLQKSFPLKNIYANGGGSITHSTRQNTDTLFYSLTAFLTWKVGQFDLNLGGNVSHSTATLPTGEQKYSTQYYFLNMKRKLF